MTLSRGRFGAGSASRGHAALLLPLTAVAALFLLPRPAPSPAAPASTRPASQPSASTRPTEPSTDDTFYVFAIWDGISGATEPQVEAEVDRLVAQFGRGNRYHRVGFAFIMPGLDATRRICRVAQRKDVKLGLILGVQTHSAPNLRKRLDADLRNYQWRMNGANWEGHFTGPASNAGNLEIKEDTRDHKVPTPSRYCAAVRALMERDMADRAKCAATVIREFPGVVTVVNGVIEEELAVAAASLKGPEADGFLADYSPYAVAEFRDWLRHTGKYDADGGAYAGQGAPDAIVGRFVTVRGKPRSPFYDDPDPAHRNGTGRSFNDTFGTKFTTWALRYWDLDAFPAPITAPKFNPSPAEGSAGATAGGFDAPRARDPASAWWQAWSWDVLDQPKRQPPGNPLHPAFGFRQVMVAHFVRDLFDLCLAAGVPPKLLFPHQIPGELVGDSRCRSSASPTWTGFLPANGNLGVTRFGPIDPRLLLQYTSADSRSRQWGIFEWHPMPSAKPDDPKLYERATHDLNLYYDNKCHYLFAGWWRNTDKIFPLDDSNFAKAIKDFLASRPDRPYPGHPARGK